jgi:hypothetical protein
MTDWKSSLRSDPIPWLMDNASAPIRYRVLTDLLGLGREDQAVQKARQDTLAYPPAAQIQRTQRKDGTWGGAISAGDHRKVTPSIENSLGRLLEFGWNRESKPVMAAAKTLRTFMTRRKDLKFFEFAKSVKADEKRERYYRWYLRALSLGLLIRSGYLDARNRTGVLELLDLTAGFVDNPASRSPVEEIGATLPLIRNAAWNQGYPFFPDYHAIVVFAFSPWLLQGDLAKMRLKKIFDYMLSPTYQSIAPELGLVRTAKGTFARGGGMRIRPVEHYQQKGDLDELLTYLELFARLGLINRYPALMGHLEWLQSQQGKDGRWSLPTKLIQDQSRWTALLRIEKDWRSPARKEADLTFRMLLILKHQWERQMIMLDRGDDGYPI